MHQIIIVGGGLAGLSAAIHLAKTGRDVLVIEKRSYPQHKVCGEYISSEILPYFDRLGIPVRSWQPRSVGRFRLHAPSGKHVEAALPLGGFGMRRYALDQQLYELATRLGVQFLFQHTVKDIVFVEDQFHLTLQNGQVLHSRVVIGSFGKRSVLDKNLDRPFLQRHALYLGVKFYLEADFPDDLVALYNFKGGYGGAVRVEDGTVDVAYLTDERYLRSCGSIEQLEQQLLHRNPAFKRLLTESTRLATRPFTISNISFAPKRQIHDHVLMIGDAAGMIPPLCGNGMAMGIHAAKLASEVICLYWSGKLDRLEMEQQYQRQWRRQFAHRLWWGRRLQPFMIHPLVAEFAVGTLRRMPGLLPSIIKQTHGTAFS